MMRKQSHFRRIKVERQYAAKGMCNAYSQYKYGLTYLVAPVAGVVGHDGMAYGTPNGLRYASTRA